MVIASVSEEEKKPGGWSECKFASIFLLANQVVLMHISIHLDIFIQLLNSSGSKTRNVRLIRVFSKAVEKKQFEGPDMNTDLFPTFSSDTKCERQHEMYSLHHIIRQNNPKIKQMEERFKMLDSQGKIASYEDFIEYKQLVSSEEEKVLKSGVNIVLCTCNEAASHRITNSLEPKYCIIDECAMATEPECMVPISRAQHVVLIGDHQQLQPVIQSKDAEEVGLGKSLFQRYAEREREVQIHLLEVQYRMVSMYTLFLHFNNNCGMCNNTT